MSSKVNELEKSRSIDKISNAKTTGELRRGLLDEMDKFLRHEISISDIHKVAAEGNKICAKMDVKTKLKKLELEAILLAKKNTINE